MNFLADQNFPRSSQAVLAEFGHASCDLNFDPNKGLSDEWLFEEAQCLKAVFLTTDKDFFHTIPLQHSKHFGAIVITLSQPNRERLLAKLRWALAFIQTNPIAGHVLLLRDHRAFYTQQK